MNDSETARALNPSRRRLLSGALALTGLGAVGAVGAGAWLSRTPVGLIQGRPRASVVQSDSSLPSSVDVVIIGGGYVGACAALTLAERGVSVALCEKGVLAGEASGRSMGYVDSQLLDPAKFELVGRSKALWSEMNSRAGIDTGYRPTGLLQALEGPDAKDGAEAWVASIRDVPGFDGRILAADELLKLLPGMIDPPDYTLYTPSDGSAEPQLAVPAIAEAARRRGARIIQGCAARGIEMKAGRVSAVVTEKGRIACHSCIVAAGAWTPLFVGSLGFSLPQLNVYMSMMGVTGVPDGPRIPFSGGSYGFRPQTDGSYSVGGVAFAAPIEPATIRNLTRLMPAIRAFWPMASVGFSAKQFWRHLWTPSSWPLDRPSPFENWRVQEPEFRPGPIERSLQQLREHFPVFAAARVTERWSGVISSTPDNMPVLGPLPGYLGVYVGSAFTFGLTMGPAAGEALADLAMDQAPQVRLQDYRLERFSDGSPSVFRA